MSHGIAAFLASCWLDETVPSRGRKYDATQIADLISITLQWRRNGRDSVSNHQPHDCLLNRLFRRRSKKTSKLRVTGLCAGNSPGPVNYRHKWPVTRKKFSFDDVIMNYRHLTETKTHSASNAAHISLDEQPGKQSYYLLHIFLANFKESVSSPKLINYFF